MAKEKSSSSGGIGFLGALALLFIGLKLGGVIHWSWWYVTLPLWGGLALFLGITLLVLVIGIGGALLKKLAR